MNLHRSGNEEFMLTKLTSVRLPVGSQTAPNPDILRLRPFARFCLPPGHPLGQTASVMITETANYDLTSISSKARNQTRRALERGSMCELTADELYREGYALVTDTLQRQRRRRTSSEKSWHKRVRDLDAAGFRFVGWRCAAELAAFIVCRQVGDSLEIVLVRSRSSLLSNNPNNGLVYALITDSATKARCVSYGLEAPEGRTVESLRHFKLAMGFSSVAVKQLIVVRDKPLLHACKLLADRVGRFQPYRDALVGRDEYMRAKP